MGQLRGRSGWLVAGLTLAGLLTFVLIAAHGSPPPQTPTQQVHAIAAGLRCPVCRDLSVADSPAPLAGQMRSQIAQQLAAGRSPDQVRQHFIEAYGDSVLMSPPHRGLGQVVYVLPLVVLGVGLAGGAMRLRSWRARPTADAAASELPRITVADRKRLAGALARLGEDEPG
jgi:cytochrome c-type biogenesis protein CcmH